MVDFCIDKSVDTLYNLRARLTVTLSNAALVHTRHQRFLYPIELLQVVEELIHRLRSKIRKAFALLVLPDLGLDLRVPLFEGVNPVAAYRSSIANFGQNA